MNVIQTFRALGPIDMQNIRRDSALSWMVFLPIFIALLLRWGLPPLTARLQTVYGFDLTPYYPVLLGYMFVTLCPLIFGMLIGFLLLDEKDDQTLTALQVTPLPLPHYVAYRVALPILLTIVLMFVIFPLAQIGAFNPWLIGVTAVAAAPLSPLFALFLASQAQNKVQGFALMKFSGALLLAPVLAFFVDAWWELAFGLIPTYWPMKVYWLLVHGESGVWMYLLGALLYQSALLLLCLRRFHKILHS